MKNKEIAELRNSLEDDQGTIPELLNDIERLKKERRKLAKSLKLAEHVIALRQVYDAARYGFQGAVKLSKAGKAYKKAEDAYYKNKEQQ